MANKKNWLGILAVLALVLGMMVVGCDDGGGNSVGGSSSGGIKDREEEEISPGGGGNTGKQAGAAVSTPTLNTKNSNSITVNTAAFTAGNSGSQTIEYGRNTTNSAPTSWQDATTFSGLNENTTYYVFARSKENTTHNAGTPSAGLSVTTDDDPNRVSRPVTNIPAGIVPYGTEILLGTTTVGATIYYTTDGNDPTIFSPVFSNSQPIIIDVSVVTVKAIATASGMTVSSVMTAVYTLSYNLGETGPGGGKIFYKSETGFIVEMENPAQNYTAHYLEASPADLIDGNITLFEWSYNKVRVDNTGTAIGTGRKNTALILAADSIYYANAAKICNEYSSGGKTDWFLPSRDELTELYNNRTSVGNMASNRYWSSTQLFTSENFDDEDTYAWYLNFADGERGAIGKNTILRVRAIRAF